MMGPRERAIYAMCPVCSKVVEQFAVSSGFEYKIQFHPCDCAITDLDTLYELEQRVRAARRLDAMVRETDPNVSWWEDQLAKG